MQSQQHSFNMPFQLACPGPDQYSDTCESATVYELELEAGDVILLATDGVLDNMWDEQIAHVIHKCLGVSLTPPPPHVRTLKKTKNSFYKILPANMADHLC